MILLAIAVIVLVAAIRWFYGVIQHHANEKEVIEWIIKDEEENNGQSVSLRNHV